MLPPDVPPSPRSVLSSNGPLSPSSEEFQTRVLQNTLLHTVRPSLDRMPSIQHTLNSPEEKLAMTLQEPPPELAQPLESIHGASSGAPSISQSIQSRKSIKMFSLFKNMTVSTLMLDRAGCMLMLSRSNRPGRYPNLLPPSNSPTCRRISQALRYPKR